jgi:prepilin-type N-terminal cleavage/methylation domain-containing protein
MRPLTIRLRLAGFTLIELMVVTVVLLILIAMAAPSIKDLVSQQRLQNIQSTLVRDLQFARSEAVRRQFTVTFEISSNSQMSCYVVFTEGDSIGGNNCDCLRASGPICTGSFQELRSVRVPASTGLSLQATSSAATRVNFSRMPLTPTGASTPRYTDPPDWQAELSGAGIGSLRTSVSPSGMTTTCSPAGSVRSVAPCS